MDFKIILLLSCLICLGCKPGRDKAGDPAENAKAGCPEEMARIPGMNACIDRWEAMIEKREGREFAVSRTSVLPARNTSFNQASAACANSGKRICALDEWDRACEGGEKRKFPYGELFKKEACNCVELYGDPRKSELKPTGSMPECKTPDGVFDMSGNLWEWTDGKDQTGNLRLLRGGGYSNQEYLLHCRTKDNAFQPVDTPYDGYGFRCCKDL
ncbi:MAG: SUMF1/EgtB/PvdO family nonheme iron enzyme [Pseudomonadota bacterium]